MIGRSLTIVVIISSYRSVDQRRHVFANRLAELVAGDRLGGALVSPTWIMSASMPTFAKQALVERGFGVHAGQQDLAGLGHDDLIAGAATR